MEERFVVHQTFVTMISDLSGKVIDPDTAGGTVSFSVGGQDLEIDLTETEIDTFNEAIGLYVANARRPRPRRGSRRGRAAGIDREDLPEIRRWATDNGYEVADRGRIKAEIIDAYHAAH